MRSFGLATLIVGTVLSAFGTPIAGQRALANSVEPFTSASGSGTPASCNSESVVVHSPQPPSESGNPCPAHASQVDEVAQARAYLIATATPGYTMTRQGPERAIGRLHPAFVNRLATAIAEARANGLPFAGIFSAYRPPAFGVGGFVDKFHSLHTYGLAVDVTGIGAPGTPSALLWHGIAARHGVICPYGPQNLMEWNHCQPTQVKIILVDNPLRETVTADGPIILEDMFEVGYSLITSSGSMTGPPPNPSAHFFDAPQARTGTPAIKSAHSRWVPQTGRSVFAGGAIQRPRPSGGKSVWPKGVPRIADLHDEPRRPNSPAASRAFRSKPMAILRIIADYSAGRK